MRESIEQIIREAFGKYGKLDTKIDSDEEQYIVTMNTETLDIDVQEVSEIMDRMNHNFENIMLKKVDCRFKRNNCIIYLKPYEYEGT